VKNSVLEEKAELEKKEKCLSSDISALQLDADSLAKEAEEKAKLVLLSKSNALRNAAKEKESALEKIEDKLREERCPRRVLTCEASVIFHVNGRNWLNWVIISKTT